MNRQKRNVEIFVIIVIITLPFFLLWGERVSKSSEKLPEGILFLPKDGEIIGWKSHGTIEMAPQPTDLFKIMNGGASLYLKYGFRSFCGQTYKDSNNVEIEASIFDQGSSENARKLYRDPMVVPNPGRVLENFEEEARVDERGLFHYGIEFIKDHYFVRVIIQEKSEKGLNTAISFSQVILQKIKSK